MNEYEIVHILKLEDVIQYLTDCIGIRNIKKNNV